MSNISYQNLVEQNISQEFRLKNTNETRNYFIEEVNQTNWWVRNTKRVDPAFNYIEHPLILTFMVPGCVSISAFASLVDIPVGIASSLVELKTCAITTGIERYKYEKGRSMVK